MPNLDPPPFVAPCKDLSLVAPIRWLRLGWADFVQSQDVSLVLGSVVGVVSFAVCLMAWWLGRFALLATLLSGFVFVAPLLAVALYAVSKELEKGGTPTLRKAVSLARRVVSQAGLFALAQLVIVLLWSRAGMMVQAFNPVTPGDLQALVELLIYGSLIGSVFAALTFAITVTSLPMIADREVDMITACLSSVQAVLRNPLPMLFWGVLIATITLCCLITAGVGFVVGMPWLAYSAWHGYRETIDASAWPPMTD